MHRKTVDQTIQPALAVMLDGFALLLVVVAVFWKLALTNLIIARGDVLTYFYPYLDYAAETTRQGRLPLWNPYLFMGVPFLANSQAGFFYPFNRLMSWLPVTRAVNLTIILHAWLAGMGLYTFARRNLRLTRPAALTSGIAFAVGGYLAAQVEHVNQLQGLAWLPWLLVWFEAGSLGWIGLALTIALQLFAGHTQAAFISLMGLGAYALLTTSLRPWRAWIKRMAALVGATVLGAGLAAVQLVPTLELAQLSMRGGGLSLREALSFSLKPALLGRALLPIYGPTIFPEYITYIGIAGLALATLGVMASWRNARPRALAIVCGLGLFFALGAYNPLYIALVRFAPGFGLFRVPARWLVLHAFGMAAMTGVGLDTMAKLVQPPKRKSWIVWGMVVMLLAALSLYATRTIVPGTDQPAGNLTTITWIGWLIVASLTFFLIWKRPRWGPYALTMLMVLELFTASIALPFNRATAPEALTSLRPPILNLKSEILNSRFLSLSDIFFDPGDKAELESAFADQLSADAFYDLLVATKQKEIIGPNLPLYYRLPSADGFDGGILPLRDYVTFQQLFVPEGQTSPDGRLREVLREVPDSKWLSLMNVRHVITDKTLDAWIDDVFYDLQFSTSLNPHSARSASVARMPRFEATAIGLVSYLQDAAQLTQGTPVAQVTVSFDDGTIQVFMLRAGIDTAQGLYTGTVAHQAAQIGGHFVRDQPEINDYVTRLRWDGPRIVTSIKVKPISNATLVIRGASLIDERTGSFQSLVISRRGDFALVHSGDVKIYQNLAALPRAYIVSNASVVPKDKALDAMNNPAFDPVQQVILSPDNDALDSISTPETNSTYTSTIVSYEPEHIIVDVQASQAGWLVLSDAYYPGWRAALDGQPTPIIRANFLFRAVAVPPGTHRVEFVYEPRSFKLGAGISLLAIACLCMFGLKDSPIVNSLTQWYNRKKIAEIKARLGHTSFTHQHPPQYQGGKK